ncbi:MAG: acylphosphatase [Micrococcales bacterium]|nr:acylphosphatase [Micrococcales bacterium]
MSERIRRHAIVHGRVQGVGFRWSTAMEAQRLGVAGRAQNLPEGTVDVVAEGEAHAVQALLAWLRRSPTSRPRACAASTPGDGARRRRGPLAPPPSTPLTRPA